MAIPSYISSLVPEPLRVMGVDLRPLSLGHYILMLRFGCRYAGDEEIDVGLEEMGDLLLGLMICKRTYEEFLEWIYSEKWATDMAEYGKSVDKWIKQNPDKFDLLSVISLFQGYLKNGSKTPLVEPIQTTRISSGTKSGAHWSQVILTVLTGQLGYSKTEALNMPLSQAFYDYYKYCENNNMCKIIGDDELKEIEKATGIKCQT